MPNKRNARAFMTTFGCKWSKRAVWKDFLMRQTTWTTFSYVFIYCMLSFPTVMLLSFFLSLCGEENSSSNSCTLVCFPGKWYRVGSSSMVTAFSDALLGKQTKWILWSVILSGRKRAERPQTFSNFLEMKQRWSDETFRIPSSKY